jgi:hypothetical protein
VGGAVGDSNDLGRGPGGWATGTGRPRSPRGAPRWSLVRGVVW